jgi:hypothetical protein
VRIWMWQRKERAGWWDSKPPNLAVELLNSIRCVGRKMWSRVRPSKPGWI